MVRVPPPFDPTVKYFDIYRYYGEDDLELVYPNGDTYSISFEVAKNLLRNYKLPSFVVERALDALWGFYAIRLNTTDGHWETIEPKSVNRIFDLPNSLSGLEWVIGTNEYP